MRNYIQPNQREQKQCNYCFPRSTTTVLNEKVIKKEDIFKYVTVHELTESEHTAEITKGQEGKGSM